MVNGIVLYMVIWVKLIFEDIKMKTTNKNYIFKVLALFLPCLFFFNFSLLTGDKLKWKASFPVVKFKVINSDIESNKNYLDIIQAAAKSWSMLETNSHFNFVYDGGSSVSYANFSSDTSCTESLKKADNSIYINESVLDQIALHSPVPRYGAVKRRMTFFILISSSTKIYLKMLMKIMIL